MADYHTKFACILPLGTAENVPRIQSRSRKLLDQICGLLRSYMGVPSGPSGSTMAGMRLFGLIAGNAGANC